jgi:hypothetical protein
MIAGEPPVGTDPGVPVEVNQPWHDEAFRGLQRAVHRPIIGLAHKRDTVVLPDHHAIAYEHVCVPIEANYRATLELRTHVSPLLPSSTVHAIMGCKVGNASAYRKSRASLARGK